MSNNSSSILVGMLVGLALSDIATSTRTRAYAHKGTSRQWALDLRSSARNAQARVLGSRGVARTRADQIRGLNEAADLADSACWADPSVVAHGTGDRLRDTASAVRHWPGFAVVTQVKTVSIG